MILMVESHFLATLQAEGLQTCVMDIFHGQIHNNFGRLLPIFRDNEQFTESLSFIKSNKQVYHIMLLIAVWAWYDFEIYN